MMKKYTEKDIVVYKNFFEPEDFKTILDYLDRPCWGWGHSSALESELRDDKPFWKMQLNQEDFFTKHLFNVIKKKTNEEFSLDRCYANGHTFGTCGNFHTDWKDETGKTALLYANENWEQEWGGKTVFNLDGEYHYTECCPNSLVIFPGAIPHRAEGTTKFFRDLRKTVAWKLVSTNALLNHWLEKTNW